MRKLSNILVTGGAGFIGSHFIRFLLKSAPDFSGRVINLDALTYAGNAESLADIEREFGATRYFFERGNIGDSVFVDSVFTRYDIDTVVHFAAESHVDRSITGPRAFIETNVLGTWTLLDAARKHWTSGGAPREDALFHHISTDEVYGSLGAEGFFTEGTPYSPRSPYSASKAASDHLAMSYHHTYGVAVTMSNCSNNYGPYQFPEKLIPLMILNILEGKTLPVYGDGKYIRDWIYVEDHNRAVYRVLCSGKAGEKYNIGGGNEWENIKLLYTLIDIVSEKAGLERETVIRRVEYVKDRPGHDRRYAIDCSKIKKELGWESVVGFEEGLRLTVEWYISNQNWVNSIRSGEYTSWIERNYKKR